MPAKPCAVERRRTGFDAATTLLLRRQYTALVELIDEQVGQIVAALRGRGWLDDTIVVFVSDHGEMLGDFGCYTKELPYEAAIRVPLVAAGPGIEARGASDALVELIDLNPTLCELAGVEPVPQLDAQSFAAVLGGRVESHREDCTSEIRGFRVLRTERHKLVDNVNDVTELYDLVDDPHETRNIASDDPATVRALQRRMTARFSAA